jgi:chloramphenicol 3-O phosphotransferase
MPQVIILNGGSSSGKTSLSRAFRDRRNAVGDFWFGLSFDGFFAGLPDEWYGYGDHQGRFSDEGMKTISTADGLVTTFGQVGRRLMNAYHETVATCARAGLQVIVDEVLFDRESWEGWQAALRQIDVRWVGVMCDPDIAEAREAARGDRSPGKARESAKFAHLHATYDLTVDTGTLSPEQATERLIEALGIE